MDGEFLRDCLTKKNRFETSAKENINIDEAGNRLVEFILSHDPKAQQTRSTQPDDGRFSLARADGVTTEPKHKEGGCPC